jgi:hypothetical protein
MVQFGARQGQLTPFSRSPGSGYDATPPEPYARPLAMAIKTPFAGRPLAWRCWPQCGEPRFTWLPPIAARASK